MYFIAHRLSLDDNIPHHKVVEVLDGHKGQEAYTAQSDAVMFAPGQFNEPKQSEKPRRRTFEEIRAENRKHRMYTNQDQSHIPHDDDNIGIGNSKRSYL